MNVISILISQKPELNTYPPPLMNGIPIYRYTLSLNINMREKVILKFISIFAFWVVFIVLFVCLVLVFTFEKKFHVHQKLKIRAREQFHFVFHMSHLRLQYCDFLFNQFQCVELFIVNVSRLIVYHRKEKEKKMNSQV